MNPLTQSEQAYPSSWRAWRVTGLLTVIYVFSFVDRQVLNLLVGPIQSDLGLSDTEVSLLQGFGFVATYVLLSIPIGRLVDTRNRVTIIALGVAFWSIATAACGLVKSFMGLLMARAGVGVGEASLTPAAWSLLADYFPPERRSFPLSIFLMGPYLGVGVAMISGGLLMDDLLIRGPIAVPLLGTLAPWQLTFLVVAAPGILLTGLMLLVREPSRRDIAPSVGVASSHDIAHWVKANGRVYTALLAGVPCIIVILYGLQAWAPTYLVRVHGLSLGEAGTRYGAIALLCGSLGVLSGPGLGRLLQRVGYTDYPLRIAAWSLALTAPALLVLAVASNTWVALGSIGMVSFLVTVPLALVASALQLVTPNRMRGVLSGAYVVSTSVVGMAMGPSLIALATDYWFQDPAAIGLSMALVGVIVAIAGVTLIARGQTRYRHLIATLGDNSRAQG